MAIYSGETYSCVCGRPVEEGYYELMDFDWVCPVCGEKIRIDIKDEENDQTVIRKQAKEIEAWDHMLVHPSSILYRVYSASSDTREKGKIFISLKGYGSISVNEDDYVECLL